MAAKKTDNKDDLAIDVGDIPMPEVPSADDVTDSFSYDTAFNFAFVGCGQGGGRIAEQFYKLGYRRVCAVNCLDYKTEALTHRGWVPGFELRKDDVLLTKNPKTGALEWQKLTALKLFPDYDGPLIEFKSKCFNAVTTPEHRWLVTQKWDGRISECTSMDMSSTGAHRIHRTGDYRPAVRSALTPDEAELLGWFVTDGGLRTDRKTPRTFLFQSVSGNRVKCERISALLARLEPGVKVYKQRSGTYYTWALGPRLSKLLYGLCPERTLTVQVLLDLDRPALERLREAMLLGDGTRGKKEVLCTGRKEQADAFQVLCTMTGSSSGSVWRDMSSYEPRSAKMSNVPKMTGVWYTTVLKKEHIQVVENQVRKFSGKVPVWCPVVPNTFFVARRGGYVFVTGNTTHQDLEPLRIPNEVKLMIGTGGAKKDPTVGEASIAGRGEDLYDLMRKSWGQEIDCVFVCLGAGGGTGSGTFVTAVEVARKVMEDLKRPVRVGIIATLPKNDEGQRPAKNALYVMRRLRELKASPVVVIDNEKIKGSVKTTALNPWEAPNRLICSLLHLFNRIAAQDSAITTFDRSDFSDLLDSGLVSFGASPITKYAAPGDISQAIRQQLAASVLASVDLKKGTKAGCIFIGGKDVLAKLPATHLDHGFDMLNRILADGSTVHRGVYLGTENDLRAYTLIGGLAFPDARIQELAKIAGVSRTDVVDILGV